MDSADFPRSTASIAGRPIHPMTVALPIALLLLTCAGDVAFALTRLADFAILTFWSLIGGIGFALLAALFGLVDFLGSREIRRLAAAKVHLIGNLIVLLLAIANFIVRRPAGGLSVPTASVVLSVLTVLGLAITGWMGATLVYRHRVGVTPP